MTPRVLGTLGLMLLAFTAGCGGDDDDAGSAGTTSSTAEATTTTAADAETSGSEVITHEGFGAIRIGMTVEEAQAAAGGGAIYEAPNRTRTTPAAT